MPGKSTRAPKKPRRAQSSVSDVQITLPVVSLPLVSEHQPDATASVSEAVEVQVAEKPKAQLQVAIDTFHRAYFDAYGAAPTWGAKQCAMVKRLVSAHGVDVVRDRIERLFAGGGPSWIQPPFTVGTLVTHFDALVAVPVNPRKSLSPSEIRERGYQRSALRSRDE